MYESKDMQESISMEIGLDADAKRFYRRWKNEHDNIRRYEFTERYFRLIYSNTAVCDARNAIIFGPSHPALPSLEDLELYRRRMEHGDPAKMA